MTFPIPLLPNVISYTSLSVESGPGSFTAELFVAKKRALFAFESSGAASQSATEIVSCEFGDCGRAKVEEGRFRVSRGRDWLMTSKFGCAKDVIACTTRSNNGSGARKMRLRGFIAVQLIVAPLATRNQPRPFANSTLSVM